MAGWYDALKNLETLPEGTPKTPKTVSGWVLGVLGVPFRDAAENSPVDPAVTLARLRNDPRLAPHQVDPMRYLICGMADEVTAPLVPALSPGAREYVWVHPGAYHESVASPEPDLAHSAFRRDRQLDPVARSDDADAYAQVLRLHGPATYGAMMFCLGWGCTRAWQAERALQAAGRISFDHLGQAMLIEVDPPRSLAHGFCGEMEGAA